MRFAGLACALLLLGIAGWEIVATRVHATSVPDDAAWQRAAQVVRAQHQAGDLVTFAPGWIDPVGRLHLGDLIPLEMAARMDDARYARAWELSIRGARTDAHRGERPAFEQIVDGVRVRRYDRTPVTVLADVLALETPRVRIAEVGFEPHRCITLQGRLAVKLPAGKLVGYAGIPDIFTRRDNRAAGRLDVEAGGKVIASIAPGVDDGWVRFEAPIDAGEVTFVAKQRAVCFAAEVRQ